MMMHYVIVVISVFAAACAQMLLKKGASMKYEPFWKQYINVWVIGGYGILFGSMLLNIFAMSRGVEVKEVSIIESLSYLFVPSLAFIFFRERLSWRKAMAIGVIIIGIIIFFI